MKKAFGLFVSALAAVPMAISEDPTVADGKQISAFSSKLEIISPEYLQKELPHQDALFGSYPLGTTVQAEIYYATSLLCSYGNLPTIHPDIVDKGFIMMADRGECSFVEKARHAMKLNASALIIADTVCLCQHQDECQSDQDCQNWEPVMDDDGFGDDITIPSMLLVKQEADALRSLLTSGTEVSVKLSYPLPKAEGGQVKYSLWTTPEDKVTYQFLTTFQHAAVELGDRAIFEPFMLVEDGKMTGCFAENNEKEIPPSCDGLCTNGGRYCAPSFHDDLQFYEDKGTKLVIESLRRQCIWDIYGKSNGIGREWWTYIENWIKVCSESHYSTNCAERLFDDSGINKDMVNTCMENSGGLGNEDTNSALDDVLSNARDNRVVFAPAMFVNGALVRGELSFGTILGAICATWEGAAAPPICSEWETCWATCQSEQCILKPDSTCTKYEAPDESFLISDFDDDIVAGLEDETLIDDSPATESQETTTSPPNPQPTDAPTSSILHFSHGHLPTEPPTRLIFDHVSSPTKPPSSPLDRPFMNDQNHAKPLDEWPSLLDERTDERAGPEIIEIIEERGGGNAASFLGGLGVGFGIIMSIAVCYLVRLHRKEPRRIARSPSSKSLEQLILDDIHELDLARKYVGDRRYLGDGGDCEGKMDTGDHDHDVHDSRLGGINLMMGQDEEMEREEMHEITFSGDEEEFTNSDDEHDIHAAEYT